MYLLDTNVISELRKIENGKANQGVVDWLASVSDEEIFTNAVVLMELERGVLRIERKDIKQGILLRKWLETDVRGYFKYRTFGIDEQTAQICAKLHIPDHAPENDAWIAATAIQHNLTLVTRNSKDFIYPNLNCFNPFS